MLVKCFTQIKMDSEFEYKLVAWVISSRGSVKLWCKVQKKKEKNLKSGKNVKFKAKDKDEIWWQRENKCQEWGWCQVKSWEGEATSRVNPLAWLQCLQLLSRRPYLRLNLPQRPGPGSLTLVWNPRWCWPYWWTLPYYYFLMYYRFSLLFDYSVHF